MTLPSLGLKQSRYAGLLGTPGYCAQKMSSQLWHRQSLESDPAIAHPRMTSGAGSNSRPQLQHFVTMATSMVQVNGPHLS